MCLNICLPSPVTSERICIFYFFVYFSIITSGGGEVNSWTCLNVKDTLHFSLKWFLKKKPFVNQNSKLRFDQKKIKKSKCFCCLTRTCDPYWSGSLLCFCLFELTWPLEARAAHFFLVKSGSHQHHLFSFLFFLHVLHRWTTCMWIILSFIKTLSQQAGH